MGPTKFSPCGQLVAMGRPQLTNACACRGHRGQFCRLPSILEGPHTLCVHRWVSSGCWGVTTALGAEGFIPSLSPSIGTGANRDWWAQACGQNSTLGRVPYTHGCPSLVTADGHPAHCPVSGLAAGWFPAPRTAPGAVTSGRPQLHPACPTDAPFRSPAARTEPSAEPRPAWKALGRQLPAEPPATSSDQPRRSFTLAEPSGLPEPGGREGWSSSLPRLGRNVPVALPRRVSHGGEVGAGTLPALPTPPNTEGRDV